MSVPPLPDCRTHVRIALPIEREAGQKQHYEWMTAEPIAPLCEHRMVVSVPPTIDARPALIELLMLKAQAPLHELVMLAHPDDRPEDTDLFGYLRDATRVPVEPPAPKVNGGSA